MTVGRWCPFYVLCCSDSQEAVRRYTCKVWDHLKVYLRVLISDVQNTNRLGRKSPVQAFRHNCGD